MKKLFYTGLFLFGCFSFSSGQIISVRDDQKREALLQQMEETTKKLGDASKNVAASLQQLNIIKQKVAVRKKYLAALKNEIADLEDEIYIVQEDIKDLTNDLEKEKEHYAQIVKGMQKNSYYKNKLLFILSAKSVMQSYRRFEHMRGMYASQKKQLTAVKEKQTQLIQKEKDLDFKRTEKVTLLNKQHAEDVKLFEEEARQKAVVDDLLRKQGALQTELNKQKQQSIDLNNLIAGVITTPEILPEKDNNATTDNKTDHTTLTPPPTPISNEQSTVGDFEKSKGRLPMPVSGKYLIIGKFGEQLYEELTQNTVTNGGINIHAQSSNDVKAVYDGVVGAILPAEGYHYAVVIRHGDYLTVYANLSSVSVAKGNRVAAGQSIGKIYSDPDVGDMAILHFQVRKGKMKLNPEIWLR